MATVRYKNVYTGQEGTTTKANFERMQKMAGFKGIFKAIETITPKSDKAAQTKTDINKTKESVTKKVEDK